MLKLGKINREKKCKIIREFNIYDIEQAFDKNANFKIFLGGCIFLNALIYNNNNYIKLKDYNE